MSFSRVTGQLTAEFCSSLLMRGLGMLRSLGYGPSRSRLPPTGRQYGVASSVDLAVSPPSSGDPLSLVAFVVASHGFGSEAADPLVPLLAAADHLQIQPIVARSSRSFAPQ
jgi:hypothetical protein